jgi:Tfp pilus assembly protein PilO
MIVAGMHRQGEQVANVADHGMTPPEPEDATPGALPADEEQEATASGTPIDSAVEPVDETGETTPVAETEAEAEDAGNLEDGVADDDHGEASTRASAISRLTSRLSPEHLNRAWRVSSVGKASIVAVVVYAVVAGAFYFLLFQPTSSRHQRLKSELGVLHDYMVIEQANAELSEFRNGLMDGDQRLTVMSEFKLMAENAGVRIAGDPELMMPRSVSKVITEYPARLRIRGTYHEIGTFLSLLESSPRFVQVEEVEILSEPDSRSSESDASVLLALASWEE